MERLNVPPEKIQKGDQVESLAHLGEVVGVSGPFHPRLDSWAMEVEVRFEYGYPHNSVRFRAEDLIEVSRPGGLR